jgi:Ser/Thr protein kinase RdoA (MazF antagonist)
MEPETARNRIMQIVTAWDVGTVHAVVDIHPGKVYRVERVADAPLILKNVGQDDPQAMVRLAFEHEVLRHLDRRGISVALPLPTRDGQSFVAEDGHLYTLSPHLISNSRWHALDLKGLERLNRNCGAAIAKLHVALAAFHAKDLEDRTWETVLPDDLFDRWIPAIRQNAIQQERDRFDAIIRDIEADMRATMESLPTQLIHRDCHQGNIIVNGERVSGSIDCDHLSIGPRVLDLASFIVHMIYEHVTDRERTAEWFELFPAVIEGYETEVPLRREEKRTLYYVMLAVLLIFTGWFFETGEPAKARGELEALSWMHGNRQRILDGIAAV